MFVSFVQRAVVQILDSVPFPPGHVLMMSISSGVAL